MRVLNYSSFAADNLISNNSMPSGAWLELFEIDPQQAELADGSIWLFCITSGARVQNSQLASGAGQWIGLRGSGAPPRENSANNEEG